MSDSVAWCILAGFKITSVFSRIAYQIIESMCEFVVSILQEYLYRGKSPVTFNVIKKVDQKKRKAATKLTEVASQNPENEDLNSRTNEPTIPRKIKTQDRNGDTLIFSEQKFCFRGTDRIIECNLHDARKVILSFELYPFQDQSPLEIYGSSRHEGQSHPRNETAGKSTTSEEPKMATFSNQTSNQFNENELTRMPQFEDQHKFTLDNSCPGQSVFKTDCSTHVRNSAETGKQSPDNIYGKEATSRFCSPDDNAQSQADPRDKQRLTPALDQKQGPETHISKHNDLKQVPEAPIDQLIKNQEMTAHIDKKQILTDSVDKHSLGTPAVKKQSLIATDDKKFDPALHADQKEGPVADVDQLVKTQSQVAHVGKFADQRDSVIPVDQMECLATYVPQPTDKKQGLEYPIHKIELPITPVSEKQGQILIADHKQTAVATVDLKLGTAAHVHQPDNKKGPEYPIRKIQLPTIPIAKTQGPIPIVDCFSDKKQVQVDPVDQRHIPVPTVNLKLGTTSHVPQPDDKEQCLPIPIVKKQVDTKHPQNAGFDANRKSVSSGVDRHRIKDNSNLKCSLDGFREGEATEPVPEAYNEAKDSRSIPKSSTASKGGDVEAFETSKPSGSAESVSEASKGADCVKPVSQASEFTNVVEPESQTSEYSDCIKPVSETSECKEVVEPLSETSECTDVVEPLSETSECTNVVEPESQTSKCSDVIKPVSETSECTDVVEPLSEIAECTDVVEPVSGTSECTDVVEPVPEAFGRTNVVEPESQTSECAKVEPVSETPERTDVGEPVSETPKRTDQIELLSKTSERTDVVEPISKPSKCTDVVEPVSETPERTDHVEPISKTSECIDVVEPISESSECAGVVKPVSEASKETENFVVVSETPRKDEALKLVSELSGGNETVEPVSQASVETKDVESIYEASGEANNSGSCQELSTNEFSGQEKPTDSDDSSVTSDEDCKNYDDLFEKGPSIIIAPDVLLNPYNSSDTYGTDQAEQSIRNIETKYLEDGWDDTDKYFYDHIIQREKEMGQLDPSTFVKEFSAQKADFEKNKNQNKKGQKTERQSHKSCRKIVDTYNPMTELPKYYDVITMIDSKYLLEKSDIKCYKRQEETDSFTVGRRGGEKKSSKEASRSNVDAAFALKDTKASTSNENEASQKRAKSYEEMGARPRNRRNRNNH